MLATILNSFKVADIRKKIAFTALMLALYRLGSYIPVPGVDTEAIKQLQDNYSSGNIDIAAAKGIKPTVTTEFSRYGLLPPLTDAVRSDFPTGGPAFGRGRKPD